jgi:spore germination cell wall hydrolase CwlJ-like protein
LTTTAQSRNGMLAKFTGLVFKLGGLAAVAIAVFAIAEHKFETLKLTNSNLQLSAMTVSDKMRELECLTKNIYWEAASEPFEGKVAVAQVTMNRVQSGRFASSVCGVVHQKNIVYEKVVCQFSWYCETTSKIKPVHRPLWRESEEVAKKVYLEGFRLPSMKDALYYHADYVRPNWNKPRIGEIGRHIFYGER